MMDPRIRSLKKYTKAAMITTPVKINAIEMVPLIPVLGVVGAYSAALTWDSGENVFKELM